MSALPKTIGPNELAILLQRTPNTIRADVNRRPQSLPPKLNIPGSAKLLWVEEDVIQWLNELRSRDE